MKTLVSTPVNRKGHRNDLATGHKLVCIAVGQRAYVMLARFKVNNMVHGGQTTGLACQSAMTLTANQ